VSDKDVIRRGLGATWWILFPCFVLLVIRLSIERTCSDPYDLLPGLASNPLWGWPLGVVYVASHLWLIGVYLLTASSSDSLGPPRARFRSLWQTDYMKIWLMLIAFVVEYLPVTLWRLMGTALHCGR
jgi:hypothetical protein